MIYWEDIISDEALVEMYKTHSLLEMDIKLGVSKQSIGRRLIMLGVTLRKPGWFTKTKELNCRHVG